MELFELPIEFQWDKGNETKNWIKHNVSVGEAEQAFQDGNKKIAKDPRIYPKQEKRYYLLGKTKIGRILYIAFTMRGRKIRIISARNINRKEKPLYEKTA